MKLLAWRRGRDWGAWNGTACRAPISGRRKAENAQKTTDEDGSEVGSRSVEPCRRRKALGKPQNRQEESKWTQEANLCPFPSQPTPAILRHGRSLEGPGRGRGRRLMSPSLVTGQVHSSVCSWHRSADSERCALEIVVGERAATSASLPSSVLGGLANIHTRPQRGRGGDSQGPQDISHESSGVAAAALRTGCPCLRRAHSQQMPQPAH